MVVLVSLRRRASPSWAERRAASSLQPRAAAISACVRSAAYRSVTAARCLGGSAANPSPQLVVGRSRVMVGDLGDHVGRDVPAPARRQVIKGLAVGDREDPRPLV